MEMYNYKLQLWAQVMIYATLQGLNTIAVCIIFA